MHVYAYVCGFVRLHGHLCVSFFVQICACMVIHTACTTTRARTHNAELHQTSPRSESQDLAVSWKCTQQAPSGVVVCVFVRVCEYEDVCVRAFVLLCACVYMSV